SSRRRHTSFSRDWSSDVCSSDLEPIHAEGLERIRPLIDRRQQRHLLPMHDLARVWAERHHDAGAVLIVRAIDEVANDGLMSNMYAVERADRYHGRGIVLDLIESEFALQTSASLN